MISKTDLCAHCSAASDEVFSHEENRGDRHGTLSLEPQPGEQEGNRVEVEQDSKKNQTQEILTHSIVNFITEHTHTHIHVEVQSIPIHSKIHNIEERQFF